MARKARSARPTLEGLEDRKLLSHLLGPDGRPIRPEYLARLSVQAVNLASGSTSSDRRFTFTTPEGGKAVITLYGLGSLNGSTYNQATGILDLFYSGTNASSVIIGHVSGGNGHVKLRTLRSPTVDVNSSSGVNSNQIDTVNLKQFDLIDGGRINLAGGVGSLFLDSIGSNTIVDLQSLPLSSTQTNPSPTSPQLSVSFVDTGNGTQLAGVGGLTVPGAASSASGSSSTSTGFITRIDANGQVSLIPVSTTATTNGKAPGVNLVVNRVGGTPRSVALANPQIYGYDPTTNSLIRFDARTGAELGAIPLSVPGAANGEVGMGRFNGRLVVLVGVNSIVQAYDASTQAFVGQFTTTNIFGANPVDGVGMTDRGTAIESTPAQQVQAINVTASLTTGQAVPAQINGQNVPPFTPTRQFVLAGGLTGAAGLPAAFLSGVAHFDAFQPNAYEAGILTATSTNDQIKESSRTALTTPSSVITNVPGNPNYQPLGLGSIDIFVAALTGFDPVAGTNTVTTYNPSGFTKVDTITLRYGNRLSGLSESFHPELAGAAVINANGIVNQFTANSVTGLAMTTIGYDNLIQIGSATDSAFVAEPIGHLNISHRRNVFAYSTGDRSVLTRNGVTIVPGLRPVGPLSLTTPPA